MSVRKRGDKWVVRVYDPRTREPVWVGTFDSKGEARDAEDEARRDLKRHRRGAESCDAFAARWMRDYPRQRTSTNLYYAERVKGFAEEFKGRRLASIDRVEARQWALANRSSYQAVRAMFSDALRDGLALDNPFVGLRLEQSRGRRDLEVLTPAEVDRLVDVAREKHGPMFEAFVRTAADTGMRPGELYALQWSSVDFDAEEVLVLESYSSSSGETTTPKNHQPRRIVLPPKAAALLAELPRGDGTYVFRTHQGKRMTGRVLHYYWDPVRTLFGKPEMALYELRHAAASHLLNDLALEAQDVAHQLGHTDGGVLVMKLYGHPSEGLARQRIKRAFGRNVKPLREVSDETG